MRVPHLDMMPPRYQFPMSAAPFHSWRMPSGDVWTEFYRTGTGYVIRFPGYSDFDISLDGSIIAAFPSPEIELATVEHLYLNQVLPLALSKSDKLIFHASAVDVGGFAVAFLAETGRGKSTLAAAFAACGRRFLTDDSLILEADAGGYRVLPSHPSIRLWSDSHERLLPANAPTAASVGYTAKARVLAGSHLTYCDKPKSLRAAYFLGPGEASGIVIDQLSAADRLIQWASNSFLIDVEDQSLIAAHFDRLAHLAEKIPCFHLDYPRNFEHLRGVLDAIMHHASRPELS